MSLKDNSNEDTGVTDRDVGELQEDRLGVDAVKSSSRLRLPLPPPCSL